ncbi:hypothetical protein B5G20_07785 [Collinsella sp. An7]|uniref:VanZ family protein n=1 Tax=Collinsella sp. An7 TaxID=1965651 RepID=UPI000B3A507C|nr:VanZ family protein [Collinsella sp. An7]OUN46477.1 hypothetical protein B5G20_07785 [Collinsella sp. An7]
MASYLNNIVVAALLFPVLAALLSLPYAIYQYRRFGSISVWKTVLVFSFIFYLICAYFMVILPLPADRTAVYPGALHPQLDLLYAVRLAAPALERLNPLSAASWWAFLKNPTVYTTLFNVLLTLPFGVYLRYLFGRPWWQAVLAGFGLSLFFEVSQITGLFGLYLHPYRLFDVDDLITNTAGTLLGNLLALPLCRFLPSMDEVEEQAIERGAAHTTFSRRLVAFAVDMAVTGAVLVVLRWALPGADHTAAGHIGLLMAATGVTFMLVPIVTRGQTVGHAIVRLRVVRPNGSSASWWSYIVRYGLLFWAFLLLPAWVAALFPSEASPVRMLGDEVSIGSEALMLVMLSVYGVWVISVLVRAVASAFHRPFVMLNGVISNTRVMSVAQADRLRAARHEATLDEELHELDIDSLGTDIDDAFDASFDSTSADEGVSFDAEEQGHI